MKIGLLYGGTSSEREVSIKSAESIYESLKDKLDLYKIDFKGDYSILLDAIMCNKVTIAFSLGRYRSSARRHYAIAELWRGKL